METPNDSVTRTLDNSHPLLRRDMWRALTSLVGERWKSIPDEYVLDLLREATEIVEDRVERQRAAGRPR